MVRFEDVNPFNGIERAPFPDLREECRAQESIQWN